MSTEELRVQKRDGVYETMSFDKILRRLRALGQEAALKCNYTAIAMKVIDQLFDGITTQQIDVLTAEQCASMNTVHPDYSALAGRVVVSNHQKQTAASFVEVVATLYANKDVHGESYPLVSDAVLSVVQQHGAQLDALIEEDRDYLLDYFGFKTLEKSYLLRVGDKIVERPQHLWMRVAIGIHGSDLKAVEETYTLMSQKYFTHATPTLFNAGTNRAQMSSCFLLTMEEDSIDGIYATLTDTAKISKYAGGIGLAIHDVRATQSWIRGTNGKSNGIVPMLRVFQASAKYVDQGGGKRNGSIAIYLEPWHADIEVFLQLRKNHGDEELKARDLFYGLWIPDLFMDRVEQDGDWTLLDPHVCPGLADVWGAAFEQLYLSYEQQQKGTKTMKARQLWLQILDAQMETGTPYLCYKDAANRKSNQQNLGTIRCSNLCTEIIEFTSPEETAVCNLASIALPAFVKDLGDGTGSKAFDFDALHYVTTVVARNLDKVIDGNFYPTEKSRRSNLRHRPLGIGVQGLADVFFLLQLPFCGPEARQLNKLIFETMYHAAILTSNTLAKTRYQSWLQDPLSILLIKEEQDKLDGAWMGAYSSFKGSPASYGQLQFDLWDVKPNNERYDWTSLKEEVQTYGLRNSLSLAPMPTASTSQILGYNECIEPITSNIYSRRTMAGEFLLTNRYLTQTLLSLGLWNEETKNHIVAHQGSVQMLPGLPDVFKELYKTVWEMPMRSLIDMAADRGAFICQSQSLNLWVEDPSYTRLTAMHLYAWKKGLKTGVYYLRRKPKAKAQQFTIEPAKRVTAAKDQEDDGTCLLCSA